MDWQAAFNLAIAVAAASMGWMLRVVYDAITELRGADLRIHDEHDTIHERISRITEGLPSTYMRRDDFVAFAGRIEDTLERIENKLDRKADK